MRTDRLRRGGVAGALSAVFAPCQPQLHQAAPIGHGHTALQHPSAGLIVEHEAPRIEAAMPRAEGIFRHFLGVRGDEGRLCAIAPRPVSRCAAVLARRAVRRCGRGGCARGGSASFVCRGACSVRRRACFVGGGAGFAVPRVRSFAPRARFGGGGVVFRRGALSLLEMIAFFAVPRVRRFASRARFCRDAALG